VIQIENDGPSLVSTNYWSTPHAQRGLLYLSGNAGALRLLVPVASGDYLAEMRTGKSVTIEPSIREPQCIDIVFEDGTDTPFSVSLDRRQCDRALNPGPCRFMVYTQSGLQLDLHATVR